MINGFSDGGLKMNDIQALNNSLMATWIKKYLDEENQGKWKLFFDVQLEAFGFTFPFTSNLNKKDTASIIKVQDSFIKEILSIWSQVNFEDSATSANQFLGLSLWHNTLIRIDGGPIF